MIFTRITLPGMNVFPDGSGDVRSCEHPRYPGTTSRAFVVQRSERTRRRSRNNAPRKAGSGRKPSLSATPVSQTPWKAPGNTDSPAIRTRQICREVPAEAGSCRQPGFGIAFRAGAGLYGHEAPFRPDCFGICVPFFRKTAAAQVQVPVQASGEDTAASFGAAFKQGLVGFIAHPRRACSLRQKTPNGLIPDPRRKLSRIVFFCFRDCVCSASGRFEAKGAVRAVRGKSVSRRIALPAASPCRMRRSFQRILRAPAVHFFWTRA